MRNRLFQGLAALALISLGTAANAATITLDDTSGNNGTDVSADLTYTVAAGAVANQYVVSFSLTNTSTLGSTRLTSFGVDFIGSFIAATSPADWGYTTGGELPGEADSFGICYREGNTCQGGGGGGIDEGDTLSGFTLTILYGSSSAAQVQALFDAGFADGSLKACARFQSIPTTGPGSGNGSGSDVACYGGPNEVPEPASLALLGLGLLGLGLSRRRRI